MRHFLMLNAFRLALGAALLIVAGHTGALAQQVRSPDGKFEASLVTRSPKDVHYAVKRVGTEKPVFTTFAQYETPNDVKAGAFSSDSKKFAAAYHYGHDGTYTWIGVWETETGRFLPPIREKGYTTNLAAALKK